MDTSAETGSDEEEDEDEDEDKDEDEDEDEDQMYETGVGVVGKKFMFCLSGQVGAMGMCCSSIFILISLF